MTYGLADSFLIANSTGASVADCLLKEVRFSFKFLKLVSMTGVMVGEINSLNVERSYSKWKELLLTISKWIGPIYLEILVSENKFQRSWMITCSTCFLICFLTAIVQSIKSLCTMKNWTQSWCQRNTEWLWISPYITESISKLEQVKQRTIFCNFFYFANHGFLLFIISFFEYKLLKVFNISVLSAVSQIAVTIVYIVLKARNLVQLLVDKWSFILLIIIFLMRIFLLRFVFK